MSKLIKKEKKKAASEPRFQLALSSCFFFCFFFFIFKGPLRGANSLIRPIKLRHFAASLNGGWDPSPFEVKSFLSQAKLAYVFWYIANQQGQSS